MTALRLVIRLSRPRFWLYVAGPVLVGGAYGAGFPSDLVSPSFLLLLAYAVLPANILLYGVNDIFDASIDARNPKKQTHESRFEGGRLVPAAVAAAGLLGIAVVAMLPAPARPSMAGFLLLAVLYSAPPVRFKARPFLDSISNGLYVLPGVAAYAALAGAAPPPEAVVGGWLWTMAMHTFSAIPDIDADSAGGVRTSATVLGERRTLMYCGLCWLASALSFAVLSPAAGALMAVYPLVVAVLAARHADIERAYWRFPALNAFVGMVLTLGGLSRLA